MAPAFRGARCASCDEKAQGEGAKDWAAWRTEPAQAKRVLADASYDIWSFGVMTYTLCVAEGAPLFLSSAADNIVRDEDLQKLAEQWDSLKLEEVASRISFEEDAGDGRE